MRVFAICRLRGAPSICLPKAAGRRARVTGLSASLPVRVSIPPYHPLWATECYDCSSTYIVDNWDKPGWKVGTDLGALERLAEAVWELAERKMFKVSAGAWNSHAFSLESPSLSVTASVLHDPLTQAPSRKLISLRFRSLRQTRPRYRYLTVGAYGLQEDYRWNNSGWRSAAGVRRSLPLLAPERQTRRPTVRLAETVWIAPKVPREDLLPQLCLFVVRHNLLREPGASEVAESLRRYLRGRSRDEDNLSALWLRLVRNWQWPEDWRGWRKYLGTARRNARRGLPADRFVSADYLSEDDRTSIIPGVPAWHPRLSIEEAAERLGKDPSYLYRMIRQGSIRPEHGHDRALLSRAQVEELQERFGREEGKRQLVAALRKRGFSHDAARKRVYRLLHRGLSRGDSLACPSC